MVQGLRLHPSLSGGTGSIPSWGTEILHAVQHGQKFCFNFLKRYMNVLLLFGR